MPRRTALAALAAAAVLVSTLAAATAAPRASSGVGDPYFPRAGNPGYDARHYAIDVRYRPASRVLSGDTTVRLKAERRLSRFSLDLLLRAHEVWVDGRRARFTQRGQELSIVPRRPVRAGHVAAVRVVYQGRPAQIRRGGESPFRPTPTGAIVVGEPQAAAWWFPSNDHPSDKATYAIALTVPKGFEAVSNGRLESTRVAAGLATWRWAVRQPMASFLAFAAFGHYDLQRGRAAGLPFVYAWERGLGAQARPARASVRHTPQAVRFLERVWGRYPFDALGGVVPARSLGFALENQTRPVYGRDMFFWGVDRSVVVHELAHQWFGDRVSLRRWRDIWLSEGWATYSEWLWAAHRGGPSPKRELMRRYRLFEPSSAFWDLTIGDPGPRRLFDTAVYDRGAMTVQALRNRVGSRDFFTIARRWTHGDGVGSTRELKRLAERVSGQQLDGLFRAWLYVGAKPARTAANGL